MNNHTNRLAEEKSPYLLQHAHNPVDWYPWGDEAFQKAAREDKPVFLSIGYSTCHWCHVMERESFVDAEIADILNTHFISIKVDREERPDVDHIYMTAVTAMTGTGGWPLSVFLTPDQKPFYGGTYFPPEARWGSPGFKDVLRSVLRTWKEQREKVLTAGESLTAALKLRLGRSLPAKDRIGPGILDSAYQQLEENFDERNGGFGSAPKFPMGHNLSFLLMCGKIKRENKALDMVSSTLAAMSKGGIWDHLGGGFHRYSTDPQWQIPHFEKMLYDQALLARVYLELYQVTKDKTWAGVARGIFGYVIRYMQDKDGGFYSAEDADSVDPERTQEDKKEGAFYLWTQGELERLLSGQEKNVLFFHYGIREQGNVLYDPHGEFIGKNVLWVEKGMEETARHCSLSLEEAEVLLKQAKERLLKARTRRPRPHLDDKVLVDWNGLMISSLALGARVLDDADLLTAARRAEEFIWKNLRRDNGRLLHRYRDGQAGLLAALDDYAFFIQGLMELYESSFEAAYLDKAMSLTRDMVRLFWDEQSGGFYFTAVDAEPLILRGKTAYDGAIPSGNSAAALILSKWYHMTADKKWADLAEKLLLSFADEVNAAPSAYTFMLQAVAFMSGRVKQIVMSGPHGSSAAQELLRAINQDFIPAKIILWRPEQETERKVLESISPFIREQVPSNGKTTVYICEQHVCRQPVTDLAQARALICQ